MDAGRQLAARLESSDFAEIRPVVIALPRGGLPVAFEVARRLRAPLDVLVIRKIGAPSNPEFGMGAIAEDGFYWLDPRTVKSLTIPAERLQQLVKEKAVEVEAWVRKFRMNQPLHSVNNRTVLLVDDGLATGVTAVVASEYLRQKGASRIILCVPVAATSSLEGVRGHFDEVVCLETHQDFSAVGNWYEDFGQVTDAEALFLLGRKPEAVQLTLDSGQVLDGDLFIPRDPIGIVLFAHGSGSSRQSPRNQRVSHILNRHGLATLLFDLLTPEESQDRTMVFDIPLLSDRLLLATHWLKENPLTATLPSGYFGASTGAAAALWAAAESDGVKAIVSRGGRPDLALPRLKIVTVPTLLIVGGNDNEVLELNRLALRHLPNARLKIVPRATHLFEEPGALDEVAREAVMWFSKHFARKEQRQAG